MLAYLKVFGLAQYARAFVEVGLGELELIGRLSETEALEFLERLRVFPGHRLRLLRAIDCLRHAANSAERRDAAQLIEDDAALERLCAQNEELTKFKSEAEGEHYRLQEENRRLLTEVQKRDAQLDKAQTRIAELEDLVQAQTEQVNFLAQQLQLVAQEDPARRDELFRSYREAFDDTQNDWAEAQSIHLPDVTAYPSSDFAKAAEVAAMALNPPNPPASAPGRSTRHVAEGHRLAKEASFVPPQRSHLAHSLDSAQVRECLAGFDVDHIIRCLANALQNKVILCVGKSRPHAAPPERTQACAIFLEPVCLDRLKRVYIQQKEQAAAKAAGFSEGGTPLSSICSPLMSHGASSLELRDTMGRPLDPLNSLAVRSAPNKWDVYGFLRDVMVNFRLEPEVSVITLFYLERFMEMSGIALTPDNWRRLVITAMMLASKVWNDESFENIEFSQLCPLYTLDEINAFERVFLKCVGYCMSVKGSEYARTYFVLRTLGAKDCADFGLEPMNDLKATRLQERCLEKQIEFRERYPEDAQRDAMNWTL